MTSKQKLIRDLALKSSVNRNSEDGEELSPWLPIMYLTAFQNEWLYELCSSY